MNRGILLLLFLFLVGAQTVALAIFRALQFNKHCYEDAPMHIDEILTECVEFSGYDINIPKASVWQQIMRMPCDWP